MLDTIHTTYNSFFNNIVTRKFPAHHYSVRVTDKARLKLNLKLYLVTILFS